MLRQAKNEVKIEGILSQVNIEYGSYVDKEGHAVDTIGGTINIKVTKDNEVLDIPVHMFAKKYAKKGGLNPAYESIEKVKKEYISIAACGDENKADKVRINRGEIKMNDFIGRDGRTISQPRITTSFIDKVFKGYDPHATFSLEFMVQSLTPVVDSEGVEVEPRQLTISTVVPQYGENVDVIPLTAKHANVVSAVEGYWEPNKCYTANGEVNFTSTTEEYEEPVDFGEPIKKVRTKYLQEFVVTSGTQTPMEEGVAFAKDDIQAALTRRTANIEEKKTKSTQKQAPAPAASSDAAPFDLGF